MASGTTKPCDVVVVDPLSPPGKEVVGGCSARRWWMAGGRKENNEEGNSSIGGVVTVGSESGGSALWWRPAPRWWRRGRSPSTRSAKGNGFCTFQARRRRRWRRTTSAVAGYDIGCITSQLGDGVYGAAVHYGHHSAA